MSDLHKAAEQAAEFIAGCHAGEYAGDREAVLAALREALAAPVVPEWQPIETAPRGRVVLVHYKNSLGNGRTMRACYYTYETLESDNTESGWADEGWYEESEAYEYLMALEHEPTRWMPLPAAPKPKEHTDAE